MVLLIYQPPPSTVFFCKTISAITLLKIFDRNNLGKISKITVFLCETFNENDFKFIGFALYLNSDI